MVLLHGFMKKAQKTPKADLDLALRRKKVGSMKKKNIGSPFDSWLREEGLDEEVSATAIQRVVAHPVEAAMRKKSLTKAEMARRMPPAAPPSTACSTPPLTP